MKEERCVESGCELNLPLDPHGRRRSTSWGRSYLAENGGLRIQREAGGGKQESLTDEEGAHLGDGVSVMERGKRSRKMGLENKAGHIQGLGSCEKGSNKESHHPICILESSLWLQHGTLEQDGQEGGRSMDSVDANHGPNPC